MDTKIVATIVGSAVALATPSISYYLTKRSERAAARHNLKLEYYRQFVDAISGIVEGSQVDDAGRERFANSVNTLQLVASNNTVRALHSLLDEISPTNPKKTLEAHDRLLSRLLWEIRKDLNDEPTSNPDEFRVRLQSSGAKKIHN